MKYTIVAVNKDGKEFLRTKPTVTDTLSITNALRTVVQKEVWFVGDIIRVEEVKDGS